MIVERRRSLERDRGQLLDAGVIASLEADAARFRDELIVVADELAGAAPRAEQLVVDEEGFAAERERILEAIGADPSSSRAASAAAEVRGELRSVTSSAERAEEPDRAERE